MRCDVSTDSGLPVSVSGFQHPVYCMRVVGTQNAHNLISVSTDGKMCSWSLDMLSQPQVSRRDAVGHEPYTSLLWNHI